MFIVSLHVQAKQQVSPCPGRKNCNQTQLHYENTVSVHIKLNLRTKNASRPRTSNSNGESSVIVSAGFKMDVNPGFITKRGNCSHMCLGCSGSRCTEELITIAFHYPKGKRDKQPSMSIACFCSQKEMKQKVQVDEGYQGETNFPH
jgi:hypothetical protein